MRVLYINHVSQMSGAEHSLVGLLTTLPRDRFDPIVALPEGGPLCDCLAAMRVPTVTIPLGRIKRSIHPRVLLSALRGMLQSRRILKGFCREQPVHLIHSNSTTAHYVGGVVARTLGLPAVWHVRDLTRVPVGKGQLNRTATRIVAISEAVRLSLLREGIPKEKIRVIHNGVDVERFRPRPPDVSLLQKNHVPAGGFVFAMIAQMVPWKRHDLFLTAAAHIVKSFPQTRFWIIGEDLFGDHPEYRRQLHDRAAEPDLAGHVSFLGFIENIVNALACADAVVVPSDQEPFGRVIIEAMAMAKPVIATRSGGPVEIIEDQHTGILVPPGNADLLAHAMEQLLARGEWREQMGRQARQHVCRHFSLGKTTRQTCELYEEIVSNMDRVP